jgi:hypothetical protein
LPQLEVPESRIPGIANVTLSDVFSERDASPALKLKRIKTTGLPEKQPAGYGLLEGGRNSLLEFAQEATLTSVPT